MAQSQFHEINNSTDVENEKIQTKKFQKTNYWNFPNKQYLKKFKQRRFEKSSKNEFSDKF